MWARLAAITPRQFGIGLAILIIAVSVQYAFKISDFRGGEQNRSAILRWRNQLLQIDSGENIYQKFNYPNPPIMALMLRPLADLPPMVGALTWYYAKVVLTILSFVMIVRMVGTVNEPWAPWAIGLAVLLSLRPILSDLMHGNVNLLILFLVISTLYAYRSGWDATAGVILALAIACKVTPALFIGYFAWKRAWRCLAGCAIGLPLFFVMAPSLFLGWTENWVSLVSWFQNMVLPFVAGGVVTSDHPNQSLPGLVFRLLTESPSFSSYVNDVYTPTVFCNWLSLSPRTASWIVKGFMAAFAGFIVWSCRTPTSERRDWRFAAEASLIVIGMLLFSERTWKHHCVTLALPFAVLSHRLIHAPQSRRTIIASLAMSQILIASTSTGLLPARWAEMAQVYGAFVVAFFALIAALAIPLKRRDAHVDGVVALRPAA